MSEFNSEQRFWLRAFPRGTLAVGAAVVGLFSAVCGFDAVRDIWVIKTKADITQSIVDGAVAIVQTIVTGIVP